MKTQKTSGVESVEPRPLQINEGGSRVYDKEGNLLSEDTVKTRAEAEKKKASPPESKKAAE